ncbi:MAG: VOC family protein [Leptothrix sp. (in: b-proteobacteria)]
MTHDLWLNLPVQALARSIAFYEALGFERQFGPGDSPSSACFVVGERRVVLMLFLDPVFAGFAGAPVADTARGAEVLISIGAASRAEVDALAERARAAGGQVFAPPGGAAAGLYGCGIADPDGHRWNAVHFGA